MTATATIIRPAVPVVVPAPLVESVLSGLERAGARLPHALAVPVIVAHAALATVAYR
ncbi:hypothetical protein [Curtobacterium sp. MCBA15_001]|uniref:hypothetical protein n=1 Tax=Curtobacterium sp. MCBA15_001 TaxID=1898731 RepID=UPI001587BE94|nr:hypothetical protein [Curtobacterium sp. MCBA15_001]